MLLSEAENKQRQQLMVREIQDAGFQFLRGRGEGIEPTWTAEESVFVLGIPRPLAIALANRFGQRAIVWNERGPRRCRVREAMFFDACPITPLQSTRTKHVQSY